MIGEMVAMATGPWRYQGLIEPHSSDLNRSRMGEGEETLTPRSDWLKTVAVPPPPNDVIQVYLHI